MEPVVLVVVWMKATGEARRMGAGLLGARGMLVIASLHAVERVPGDDPSPASAVAAASTGLEICDPLGLDIRVERPNGFGRRLPGCLKLIESRSGHVHGSPCWGQSPH